MLLKIVVLIVALLLPRSFTYSGATPAPNPLTCTSVKISPKFQHDLLRKVRVIGGDEAKPGQFPYQVFVKSVSGFDIRDCGGSLISNKWILTAARCVDNENPKKNISVLLGALQKDNKRTSKQQFSISSGDVIVHEHWNKFTGQNDIALLKLPKEVKFTDQIKRILLPEAIDASLTFDGAPVTASGWGKTSNGSTNALRYVESDVLNVAVCNYFYCGKIVYETHICMNGINRKSTCTEDSGGPLAIKDSNGCPVLVGVASFGDKYCDVGFPSVFARVTTYLPWIYKHTEIKPR